jgi:acyl carrier protein
MSSASTVNVKQRVEQAVYAAIDELNEQLEEENQIPKSPQTVLLGRAGKLDSIAFINLIVLLEEKCEEECGVLVSLSNSNPNGGANPFETINSLIDYLERVVTLKSNS